MKRTRRSRAQKTVKPVETKPTVKKNEHLFGLNNYLILSAGLVLLFIGFYCLAQPAKDPTKLAAEGFLSLNVAPVLLILTYLVIIPIGILVKKKQKESTE